MNRLGSSGHSGACAAPQRTAARRFRWWRQPPPAWAGSQRLLARPGSGFQFLANQLCDLGYRGQRHRSRLLQSVVGARLGLRNDQAHPLLMIVSAGLAALPSTASRKVRRLESASGAMLVQRWRSGSRLPPSARHAHHRPLNLRGTDSSNPSPSRDVNRHRTRTPLNSVLSG